MKRRQIEIIPVSEKANVSLEEQRLHLMMQEITNHESQSTSSMLAFLDLFSDIREVPLELLDECFTVEVLTENNRKTAYLQLQFPELTNDDIDWKEKLRESGKLSYRYGKTDFRFELISFSSSEDSADSVMSGYNSLLSTLYQKEKITKLQRKILKDIFSFHVFTQKKRGNTRLLKFQTKKGPQSLENSEELTTIGETGDEAKLHRLITQLLQSNILDTDQVLNLIRSSKIDGTDGLVDSSDSTEYLDFRPEERSIDLSRRSGISIIPDDPRGERTEVEDEIHIEVGSEQDEREKYTLFQKSKFIALLFANVGLGGVALKFISDEIIKLTEKMSWGNPNEVYGEIITTFVVVIIPIVISFFRTSTQFSGEDFYDESLDDSIEFLEVFTYKYFKYWIFINVMPYLSILGLNEFLDFIENLKIQAEATKNTLDFQKEPGEKVWPAFVGFTILGSIFFYALKNRGK